VCERVEHMGGRVIYLGFAHTSQWEEKESRFPAFPTYYYFAATVRPSAAGHCPIRYKQRRRAMLKRR
jgi:hypothetical protein